MNQSLLIIKETYPGRAILTKKEVASLLRVCPSTMDRWLAENKLDELPKFKRFGGGKKARYQFSITAVAEFLESESNR